MGGGGTMAAGIPAVQRGTLRLYLGAAPGVGKTYAMLGGGASPPGARRGRGGRAAWRRTTGS